MKNLSLLQKIIIPVVTLTIGLFIGLGISHIKIKKEQMVFQDKLKEANRKIAFLKNRMEQDKKDAVVSIEQKCQGDLDKIDKLENEKNILGSQVSKLKEQIQKMETQVKTSDEALTRIKKESDEASVSAKKDLQEMERNNKNLGQELKKITEDKQSLIADLKKKTQELDNCASNNADLCIIAEELVEKYKNKGIGAVLTEKEPLTQINKVKLEQLTQKYKEEIRQKKINRK
jgi:chromosome segregation ATPase